MKSNKVFAVLTVLCFLLIPFGNSFAFSDEGSVINLAPSTTAGWSIEGNQKSASLGFSWSPAGDVNDDGFADIVIGIYKYDTSVADAGRVIAFYGSPTGFNADNPDWSVTGNNTADYLGVSVSGAGDVNDDGFDDVLVGPSGFDSTTNTNAGAAFLYYGSETGLETSPAWTATGSQVNEYFGYNLVGIGDVRDDDCVDIAVGAHGYDGGEVDEGKVYVFFGGAGGLSLTADWSAESNQANAQFGRYLNGIGDINMDGYDDLLVASPMYDTGEFPTDGGAVFAWYGSEDGLGFFGNPTNADWHAASDQANIGFGSALGTPGDVNGDGFDDVVIGSTGYDYTEFDDGVVFLWYGSEFGINGGENGQPSNVDWVASSRSWGHAYGSMAVTPADINADGFADIVIGCTLGVPGVYAYFGSVDGPNDGVDGSLTNADWQVTVAYNNEFRESIFGWLAGSLGDINGDGVDDIAVVARDYQNFVGSGSPSYHEGKIWAYYTNAGKVSGTATYTGSQPFTGQISVSAHLNLNDPPVASSDEIVSGEVYTIYGLDNNYYIAAAMDIDGSGGPPDPDEPIGWYDGNADSLPDLVSVSAGSVITGKNIILTDPGSISGIVTCGGCLGVIGPIRVTAHLNLVDPPLANADSIDSGGTYIIEGLPIGNYYIAAYLDVNDSGGPPDPGEPNLMYDNNDDGLPDKVTVTAGANITGINMVFVDCFIYIPLILR